MKRRGHNVHTHYYHITSFFDINIRNLGRLGREGTFSQNGNQTIMKERHLRVFKSRSWELDIHWRVLGQALDGWISTHVHESQ